MAKREQELKQIPLWTAIEELKLKKRLEKRRYQDKLSLGVDTSAPTTESYDIDELFAMVKLEETQEESVSCPAATTSVSENEFVLPTSQRAHSESLADPLSEAWIPDEVVIAFVDEFERAHQYFLCRKHVREVCDNFLKTVISPDDLDVDDIAYEIFNKSYQEHNFKLLDMDDVLHVVEECIWRCGKQDRDPYEYRNPIFYLIFRICEKGYVLEKDPRMEIEKLLKFTPNYYYRSLVCWKPPVEREARTVQVHNISNTVTGKDVWKFFRSCGEIEHIEMKSGHSGKSAYITCKDLISANNALDLYDFPTPFELHNSHKPLLVKLPKIDASGAGSAVKKAEDIWTYAVVVKKYEVYCEYYKSYQSKPGAENEESPARDECWDECEWMQKEAFFNGGFTVGGLKLIEEPL